MKIAEFIKENTEETKVSIKYFKEQPLNSLGQLIPVGMVVTSIVGFVVAIIKFVISGGFSNQISAIKGDFFGGISEGFTSGTASVLTSGVVLTIISILLLAELLVLIISYCKTESKVKKIIASICLGIGIVLFGIAGFILAVGFGVINLSEKMKMKIIEMLTVFDGMQTATLVNGLKITAVIGVVALIVFIILMLISDHRWMIKNSAIALLLSYIIIPLALLVVENVIPMIFGIIAIVVIGGVFFFAAKIFLSGDGESSSSSGGGYSGGSYNEKDYGTNEQKSSSAPTKPSNQREIKDWWAPFWRDKGGWGFAVPLADCIYTKNAWGEKTYVCTVHDFEKGNVAIIDSKTKSRVMNIAGCKYPAK